MELSVYSIVTFFIAVPILSIVLASLLPRQVSSLPACHFSCLYSQEQIFTNATGFGSDVLYWAGRFHQNRVGHNTQNGMTYDGTLLDPATGFADLSG